MKKKRFTQEQHQAFSARVRFVKDELLHLRVECTKHYPKTTAEPLEDAHEIVREFCNFMDEQIRQDCPGLESTIRNRYYFGPADKPNGKSADQPKGD
jgi:hypothetical protein